MACNSSWHWAMLGIAWDRLQSTKNTCAWDLLLSGTITMFLLCKSLIKIWQPCTCLRASSAYGNSCASPARINVDVRSLSHVASISLLKFCTHKKLSTEQSGVAKSLHALLSFEHTHYSQARYTTHLTSTSHLAWGVCHQEGMCPNHNHVHAKSVALPAQGRARSDPTDCAEPLSMNTDA